jgi:hypothetical protein
MSHRLIVRSEAETDITEAALWYEDREAGLGFGTHCGNPRGNPASG